VVATAAVSTPEGSTASTRAADTTEVAQGVCGPAPQRSARRGPGVAGRVGGPGRGSAAARADRRSSRTLRKQNSAGGERNGGRGDARCGPAICSTASAHRRAWRPRSRRGESTSSGTASSGLDRVRHWSTWGSSTVRAVCGAIMWIRVMTARPGRPESVQFTARIGCWSSLPMACAARMRDSGGAADQHLDGLAAVDAGVVPT